MTLRQIERKYIELQEAITKWAKKTKQIPDEITPNMSMRLGTKLEAPILDIFTEEHPELTVYETGTWANKENPCPSPWSAFVVPRLCGWV